jgi:hypothetical protein
VRYCESIRAPMLHFYCNRKLGAEHSSWGQQVPRTRKDQDQRAQNISVCTTSTIHQLQEVALPSPHSTSAGARLANIPELVGVIFINLTMLDLVRVQQVCRRWRDCVRNVSELRSALYKQAMPATPSDNSYFKELDNRNSTIQYKGSETHNDHSNIVGHRLKRKVLKLIKAGGTDGRKNLDSAE